MTPDDKKSFKELCAKLVEVSDEYSDHVTLSAVGCLALACIKRMSSDHNGALRNLGIFTDVAMQDIDEHFQN
jgi:hypothetical protein